MTRRDNATPRFAAGFKIPGPLYPDRCLECSELTRETYGSVCPLRCTGCVRVDPACQRAGERALADA